MTAIDTVIARNNRFQNRMIFHSDREAQYAAKVTENTLKSNKAIQSMSRKGIDLWEQIDCQEGIRI